MNKFTPLEEETGRFIFTRYGSTRAIVLQGDKGFLFRSDNLIHNFCPERGDFHQLDEITGYVIISEKDMKAGLRLYFYLQNRIAGERSADKAHRTAKKQANKFWKDRVEETYFPIFVLEDGVTAGYFYPYGISGKKAKTISLKEY